MSRQTSSIEATYMENRALSRVGLTDLLGLLQPVGLREYAEKAWPEAKEMSLKSSDEERVKAAQKRSYAFCRGFCDGFFPDGFVTIHCPGEASLGQCVGQLTRFLRESELCLS